ncbi:hypothetical protein WA026_019124 [Henosepilachna vigintioctopunctata]|uniref:Uncharacterized protein n=1 Tax=Henosepilachna vigintioctopunctata TaxID=420089 RepID=A0AAW1V291_9CUCU
MLFKITVTILAIFCSNAHTEYHHGGGQNLQTVPQIESYGKIKYPHYDIIDLGTHQKGLIPPKVVQITKKVVIREPKPYPVEIPHPVPYPVPHKVPFPVVHTKILKVPEPVPFPVTKTVHVPLEVPKPYPVSAHEYQGSSGDQTGYGGGAGGFSQHDNNQINYGQYNNQGNYDQHNNHENLGQSQDIPHASIEHDSYSQASPIYGVPGQESGQPLGQYSPSHGIQENYDSQNLYTKASSTYGVPGLQPGHPLGLGGQQNNDYQVNYQVSHEEGNGEHPGLSEHDASLDKSDYQISESSNDRGNDESSGYEGHQETEEHH